MINTPHQRNTNLASDAALAAPERRATGTAIRGDIAVTDLPVPIERPVSEIARLRVGTPFAGRYAEPVAPSFIRKVAAKASRFLARNVRTRTLTMRNAQPLVTFSFDDVPASGCCDGAAILESHSARGTYFIAGAGCGQMSPSGQLASVDQLRALAANGHEIGCHTFTHPPVGALSLDNLDRELQRNRDFLGEAVGIVPHNFAFPYGDLSFRAKRYLERRFDSCRSDRRGVNVRSLDLGALKSLPLENASINRAKIMALIEKTIAANGWLIFSSHAVEHDPGRFGVTPDLLSFTIAAAKSHGCRTVTIAEGLALASGQLGASSRT